MTTVGVRRDRDARDCYAVSYDDRVTTSSVRPVVLRNGVDIEDPLRVVLGFLKAPGRFDVSDPSRPASFGEADLRLANRSGARISAAQIAAILEIEHIWADHPERHDDEFSHPSEFAEYCNRIVSLAGQRTSGRRLRPS